MKTILTTVLSVLATAALLSGCDPKSGTPAPKAPGGAGGVEQPAPGSANPNSGVPGPGSGGPPASQP